MKSTTATVLSFYLTVWGLQKQLFEQPQPSAPIKAQITEIRKLVGHSGQVLGVAFSPDGSSIATGGEDRSIRIWNTASGQQSQTLLGHSDVVTAIVYLPSGEELLSVSRDKTARLWDLKTGKEIRRFEGSPEPLQRLDLDQEGQRFLTSGEDNVARLWDVATGKQLESFEREDSEAITGIGFIPDTKEKLFIADTSELRVWDVGGERSTFGHFSEINFATLTRDGKYALIARNGNFSTDVELRRTPTEKAPRGKKKSGFHIYRNERPEQTFSGHTRPVNVIAVSADGKFCLTGSGDLQLRFGRSEFVKPDNTVRVWELATGKETAFFEGHSGQITGLAVSRDGQFAVSTSADNTVRLLALPR